VTSLLKKILKKIRSVRNHPKPLVSPKRDLEVMKKSVGRRTPTWHQIKHIQKVLSKNEWKTLVTAIIVFVFSFVSLLYSVVGLYSFEVPKVGGTYREGIVGTPQLINPLFSTLNDVDADIVKLVYSGLMRYDSDRNLVTDLAEAFEESEDKRTYTFHLRENATWHDGTPVTAQDVVFTFQTILDSEVGSPLRVSFQGVTVDAFDEKTVQFTLEEPYQSFLPSLTVGILPEHIWSTISAESMRLAQRNLKPVGSGPYVFDTLIKDGSGVISRVELVRFEEFYRQAAYIDNIEIVFFIDYEGPEGAIQAMRQQKVDGLHFIPFDLRDKVERKGVSLKTIYVPQYTALFFNQDNNAVLKDDKVRTALATSIDRDRIVRETLDNEGTAIYGPILNGFPGFDSAFRSQMLDLEKANEVLDPTWKRVEADTFRAELKEQLLEQRSEALVDSVETESDETNDTAENTTTTPTTSTEGVLMALEQEIEQELDNQLSEAQLFYRRNGDGNVLTISVVTADTPEYRSAAELIAANWQDIGVSTNITYVPPKDITREVLRERKYDVLLYGVIIGSDPDQYPFWHSSQVDYPGLNLSRYVNRSVDEVLDKIRAADPVDQPALYTELQTEILEDNPAVFLYSPTYTYVLTEKVQGFDVTHIAHPSDRFSGITDWYIRTKRVRTKTN